MPKRSLFKLILLSLISLGTVIICAALFVTESSRRSAASSPGVPAAMIYACFIVYPLLSACVGLISGTGGHYLCFLPAACAFLMSIGTLSLTMIFPYAIIGCVFFAISYYISRFLRAHGQSELHVDLTAILSSLILIGIIFCYLLSNRRNMLPIALLFWAVCTTALVFRYKLKPLPARTLDTLSRPLGTFLVIMAYTLTAALLLCPLDALDLMEYEAPLFFTVPLCLVGYPLIFILTGAAAGSHPRKLWPVPLAAIAVLFALSNCFDSLILSLRSFSNIEYYVRNSVTTMLVYIALGYLAMLLSWLFFWNNPETYVPRLWAALGTLAAGPLLYGASYVPGFLWGHPLWGEALWYILHLSLAATVGILSGGNIRRYILMPFLPLLVTYIQVYPPVIPGTQPKLPWELGKSWAVICFFVCTLCMLLKFFLEPKNKSV